MQPNRPIESEGLTLNRKINRREFINATSVCRCRAGAEFSDHRPGAADGAKPAILGGPKAHAGGFPGWPVFDQTEENAMLGTLRGKQGFAAPATPW